MLNKMGISSFLSGNFWEKRGVGGGKAAIQYFCSFKRALVRLVFDKISVFLIFLGLQVQYECSWKTKQNIHASVILILTKKETKFYFFVWLSLKPPYWGPLIS